MDLVQYIKTLCFILWDIIVFLCPCISLKNIKAKKYSYFLNIVSVYKYLNLIFTIIKDLINKKILKNKNNSTAGIPTAPNNINKNKNSVSSRIKSNNNILNQSLKIVNLLYTKRLKDAPATQNLISKQHIFRLQDKCACLYPFVSKNYRCSELFLIFT